MEDQNKVVENLRLEIFAESSCNLHFAVLYLLSCSLRRTSNIVKEQ